MRCSFVASFLFQPLQIHHFPVGGVALVQLLMGAEAGHPALVDEQHPVHLLDGGNPVGNEDGGLPLAGGAEIAQDVPLGLGVHGGDGVVQNQDGGILHQRPGNGNPLLLAAGDGDAPLSQHGIISLLEFGDVLVHVRQPGGPLHGPAVDLPVAKGDALSFFMRSRNLSTEMFQ